MSYHVKCDRCRLETAVAPRVETPQGWHNIVVLDPEKRSGSVRLNVLICNRCDEELRTWFRTATP